MSADPKVPLWRKNVAAAVIAAALFVLFLYGCTIQATVEPASPPPATTR